MIDSQGNTNACMSSESGLKFLVITDLEFSEVLGAPFIFQEAIRLKIYLH